MSDTPVYLAIDLGASSGRVMAGYLDDGVMKLEEVNRFPSVFSRLPSGRHWDLLQIYNAVLESLRKAGESYGESIAGIGVDTWGVDYGLLDRRGRLLGDPYQYRDSRTDGVQEALMENPGREMIYEETGIQFMFFNTINQLVAEKRDEPGRLEIADSLLFLPDLFSFWLCGEKAQERTIASTSQLWNPRREVWSGALIEKLGFPAKLFQPVTEPGTVLSPLRESLREATGLGAVPVIAVAGHDTGSAVAGSPLTREAPVFLSSGTWSIMGMESSQPIVTGEALAESFSNEAGVNKTTRFLKNICGMWLIEQLLDQWSKEGQDYSYANVLDMAREAKPFLALIDPDDPRFAKPGKMADRILDFCRETGQNTPETKGELVRIAFESLACKYRIIFEKLEELAGKNFPSLRIVGGGSQNEFLNQCTANALGRSIHTGPVEATSAGNILMQMIATGALPDLASGRALVRESFETRTYEPESAQKWEEPVARLKALLTQA